MTEPLVLYTNPMSRGRIAHWMLEEIGAPYEVSYIDYGPPMKGAAYTAINPMGKVPALRHGTTVVTECGAICAYLADTFPDADLAPPPGRRGAYYRWLFFGAGPLEAAVTNAALKVEVPEERRGFVGYGSLELVHTALVAVLGTQPYLAGERFTAADVYTGAQIAWGLHFGTLPKHPVLEEYAERITARPAHGRAMAADDAAMPASD